MENSNDVKAFTFNFLPKRSFSYESQSEMKTLLMKWSMKGRLLAQAFNFDQPYQIYQKDKLFGDFFRSREASAYLNFLARDGGRLAFSDKVGRVEAEQMNATVLSLEFFDRIFNDAVVRKSGHICQCLSEYVDEIEVADELRKMLIIEDSDYYSLFDESERKEFLFRIFMHLALGGELCQPEVEIQPLLDAARIIYKDIVSVAKEPSGNRIRVISDIFQLKVYDENGNMIYPSENDHIQNFAYAAVDPIKRHITMLYHRFGIGELPKAM